MTLDEIAIKHGTDKATIHTRTYAEPHGYTIHFEKCFEPLREKQIKLLEIGVGSGESIRTWLEYFPNASIFGLDNVAGTNPWNTVKSSVHPRYIFINGDQTDKTMWKCLVADYGKDWDIIIDDGGHFANQTIISFNAMWPNLKSGGLYIIEDLNVAYGPGSVFIVSGYPNPIDFLKSKIDETNQGAEIESIYFSKYLAIIRKK